MVQVRDEGWHKCITMEQASVVLKHRDDALCESKYPSFRVPELPKPCEFSLASAGSSREERVPASPTQPVMSTFRERR
jgi:hypothetical protein